MTNRIEDGLMIRTQRQAEEASVGVETQAASLRQAQGVTDSSFSFGLHASRPASAAEGDRYFSTDRNWLYYYTGTAWAFLAGIHRGTNAQRAAIAVTTADDGAEFFVTDANTSNGFWRVVSGAWIHDSLPASPDVATSYKVAGTKVVSTQGAAVADAAGGVTVDAEARTAINTLLSRLRAHGLIA